MSSVRIRMNMKIENKREIITRLKANIENELVQSKKDLDAQTMAIDIDEEDVIESEDLSHQTEAKDLQVKIQERISLKQGALQTLQRSEFEEKHDKVDFGSVFMSDSVLYVVGVDHNRFQENNQEIMPISIDSPFFIKVRGFEEGSEVDFNGKKVRIDAIA